MHISDHSFPLRTYHIILVHILVSSHVSQGCHHIYTIATLVHEVLHKWPKKELKRERAKQAFKQKRKDKQRAYEQEP